MNYSIEIDPKTEKTVIKWKKSKETNTKEKTDTVIYVCNILELSNHYK